MGEICRTCGRKTYKKCTNIYNDSNNALLLKIQLVTGLWLEYAKDLPIYICNDCLHTLNRAIMFRARCIAYQKELKTNLLDSLSPNSVDSLIDVSNVMQNQEDELYNILIEKCVEDVSIDNDNNSEAENQEDLELFFTTEEDSENEDTSIAKVQKTLRPNQMQAQNKSIKGKSRKQKRKKEYMCDKCGRHFMDYSNFKMHQLRHTGVKKYQCDTCMSKFYTPHLLKRHTMIHSKIPLFHCPYCDKTTNNKQNIIKHQRIHTKERPYICESCNKGFTTSGDLRNHTVVHTGIRNFHCETCDKWFSLRKTLKQHYASITHKQNILKESAAIPM